MSASLREIARALGGEISGDQVLAPGPRHSRSDRSLSVKLSKSAPDGLLINSFAGDDPIVCKDYVRGRIGMPAWKSNGKEATYQFDFRDPQTGEIRYSKVRHEYTGKPKKIYFKPAKRGGSTPLLYGGERLAQLTEGRSVWIVEGENKVDALWARGAIAVSCDTGAKSKWLPEHAQLLHGLPVILWPDSDAAGETYIANAAAVIRTEDPGADIRVVRPFPMAKHGEKGKDVCNWAGSEADFAALVESAVLFEAEPEPDAVDFPGRPRGHSGTVSPFLMRPSGLYWCDPEGAANDLFLAGPFRILAETRDKQNYSWGLLLQWKDHDGREKIWSMPKALLAGDGSEVRRVLIDGGLEVASGAKARGLLTNYLVSQRSENRARAVPATGWHNGQFVFPDSSVGDGKGETCFFQTEQTFNHNYAVRGTLQEWKDNVARLAEGNSRVAFSISVALAAVLMDACHIESGGFHHYGSSSIGKSTTLDAAGSVWGGGGKNGFLTSWRATVNGLEGVAVTHNHACLCLDELGQAQAKDASEAAYMLANGSGKNRSGRTGSARKPAEWALFFLSSGEITLADKIAEDSRLRRRTAGQEVRLVEIPFDAGAKHGLFENIHGFASSQAFADHLKKSAREYYGTAARAFIEAVAGDLDAVAPAVKQGAADFIANHCPEGADFQTRRVLHRFGFVAASVEVAIVAGILPWQPGEAATAAKICFDAWIVARGGVEPAEIRNGIRAIRDFVSAHMNSRFMAAWEPKPTNALGEVIAEKIINLAGYRERDGDAWDFYFTPGAWREALAGLDPKAIAKALAEKGLLEPGEGRHAAKQIRVPGYGTQRLYHVKAAILEDGQ